MKLYKIFTNILLNEGRVEDTKRKYPNIDIDTLSSGDPSGNNKYLMWMAKMVNGGEDSQTVIELIQKYHENLPKIDNSMGNDLGVKNVKDINSFESIQQLISVINKAESKLTKSTAKKDTVEIYNKKGFEVVVPLTVHASCSYGKNTKWCIAVGNPDDERPNHRFDEYSKHSVIYIVKNNNLSKDDVFHKVAVQKYKNNEHKLDAGRNIYWDATDSSSKTPPSDWPIDMLQTIDVYHDKAEEVVLKRNIKNLKTNPSDSKYLDLYNHLSNNERKLVINKLIINKIEVINNKNLYEKLIYTLSEEELYKLFREIKHLNKDVSVLKRDPLLLYKKFSRSEEQVNIEDRLSYYLMLVKGNWNNIQELRKVDSYDPHSHKLPMQMKIKTKFDSNLSVKYIVTTGGLLDRYTKEAELTKREINVIKGYSKDI